MHGSESYSECSSSLPLSPAAGASPPRARELMTTILKYLDLKRILILKWTTPERNNRNPYNRTLNKL